MTPLNLKWQSNVPIIFTKDFISGLIKNQKQEVSQHKDQAFNIQVQTSIFKNNNRNSIAIISNLST
jgi:uncharacterized membrane protein SpoIIM required for sporulation